MRSIIPILALIILLGCGGSPVQEGDFDLCACQVWDEGIRDMSLSEKCIDACLDKFGPTLEGMEEWFAEHCDPYEPKPDTEEHIAQAH